MALFHGRTNYHIIIIIITVVTMAVFIILWFAINERVELTLMENCTSRLVCSAIFAVRLTRALGNWSKKIRLVVSNDQPTFGTRLSPAARPELIGSFFWNTNLVLKRVWSTCNFYTSIWTYLPLENCNCYFAEHHVLLYLEYTSRNTKCFCFVLNYIRMSRYYEFHRYCSQ